MRVMVLNQLAVLILIMAASPLQAGQTMRLVSADAGATHMITALGLADSLVAVDVTSQVPEERASLARIGYHRNLSAEGLLSLSPTHLVGTEKMGPNSTLDVLESAGVTLIRLPAAYSLPVLEQNLQRMAAALGRESQANVLQRRFAKRKKALKSRSLKGLEVAFLLRAGGSVRLAGSGTAGQAFIDVLGGENVVAFANYRTVSMESLLAMTPDVVLVAGETQQDPAAALLKEQPLLAQTPAGQAQRFYSVNSASLVAGLSLAALAETERVVDAVARDAASQHHGR